MNKLNIVAIQGKSGVGKTTIAKILVSQNPEVYHLVNSYTDRPKRYDTEVGHLFLTKKKMDIIYDGDNVVAKTQYGDYRYCTTINSFLPDNTKCNLYVVDKKGIYDLREYSKKYYLNLLCIEIQRNLIDIDEDRANRDDYDEYKHITCDYVVKNNGNINDAVSKVNEIINNQNIIKKVL